jgi:hypothetical protein
MQRVLPIQREGTKNTAATQVAILTLCFFCIARNLRAARAKLGLLEAGQSPTVNKLGEANG